MGARLGFVFLFLCITFSEGALAFPPNFATNGPAAARYLNRWIERMEERVSAAEKSGVLSEEQREWLYDQVRRVKRMRNEALADNMVTTAEREAIHAAIGEVNMEIAEARFGHHDTSVAAAGGREQYRRERTREPREDPGTATVAPAF